MKYGDVINLTPLDCAFYFYTGSTAIPPDYESGEVIPKIFPAITQFPPQYFIDLYDGRIWIPKCLEFKICDSVKEFRQKYCSIYKNLIDMERYYSIESWATVQFDSKEYLFVYLKSRKMIQNELGNMVKNPIYHELEFDWDDVKNNGKYAYCSKHDENLYFFNNFQDVNYQRTFALIISI